MVVSRVKNNTELNPRPVERLVIPITSIHKAISFHLHPKVVRRGKILLRKLGARRNQIYEEVQIGKYIIDLAIIIKGEIKVILEVGNCSIDKLKELERLYPFALVIHLPYGNVKSRFIFSYYVQKYRGFLSQGEEVSKG